MHNLMKIEFPSAIEIVSAKFDNALELADKDAVVYGGVVRDMIAGLPLEGDLDIVASYDSYIITLKNFRMSGKWVESHSHGIFEDIIRPSGYKKNRNISKTVTFRTFADTKVQLVQASSKYTRDAFKTNLEVIKSVDMICCGLIMDVNGNIFEVLDNAHNDCLNRILRLNKSNCALSIKILQERIAKLLDRGWKSKINIEKVEKMLRAIEEAAQKEPKKKINFNIEEYIRCFAAPVPFKSKIVVDKQLVKMLGGSAATKHIAHKVERHTGHNCKMSPLMHKYTSFTVWTEFASNLNELKPALIDAINRKMASKDLLSSRESKYSYVQKQPKVSTYKATSYKATGPNTTAVDTMTREAVEITREAAEEVEVAAWESQKSAEVSNVAEPAPADTGPDNAELRVHEKAKKENFAYQYAGMTSLVEVEGRESSVDVEERDKAERRTRGIRPRYI